jgi:ABC-type sugar transport system ATPase subunit
LVAYSDRVSVMQDRRQVGILSGYQLSVPAIVSAIAAPAAHG